MAEAFQILLFVNQMENKLLRWRESYFARDALVREAGDGGLSINRIATLMGVSRQTVTRILDGDPRTERQAPR